MTLVKSQFAALVGLVLVSVVGCSGGDAGDPELRRNAYELRESGLTAFKNGDYKLATAELSEAVQGGLNPDTYSEAAVCLAVSFVHLDKFDEAKRVIADLEKGAPNVDEVLAAKSYLYAKQGKQTEAKKLLSQARRINPKVKVFKD